MSDMSIGMANGDTGIGITNEAAFSVTGIIIGEPPFFQTVANCSIRVKRTAFPASRLNITCESPAPKANDDFAKAKFCSEIAKVKNAQAFGVRCTGWLCDVLLNRLGKNINVRNVFNNFI